jgi:hypothetical protein
VTRLADAAHAIKSANAGASWLTFDVVFADQHTYQRVCRAAVLSPALFARLYGVDPAQVRVFHCEPVLTIKVTIPRATAAGGADETDFDGVQQFAPLLDVDVPG